MSAMCIPCPECKKCGHIWIPRKFQKEDYKPPKICPKCKSSDWDK